MDKAKGEIKMIPIVGIMIGSYIFTRMVALGSHKDTGPVVKLLCGLTAVMAALGMLLLLSIGNSTSTGALLH